MTELIETLMPECFDYVIEKSEIDSTNQSFTATIRLKCSTENDIYQWKMEFENKTKTNWIVYKWTPPPKNFQFNKIFVCHYNARNKCAIDDRKYVNRIKNTGCNAKLRMKLLLTSSVCIKRDPLLRDGFVGCIELAWTHNHPLICAETLSYRAPSDTVKFQIFDLFNSGMNVKAVKQFLTNDIELKYGIEEAKIMEADASVFPKESTLYRFFDEWRRLNLGGRDSAAVNDTLKKKSELYSARDCLIEVNENPFAIAIVTSLMKRVHTQERAAEICFVDSTACCDDENHVITFMLTATEVGALPLAVIITKGTSAVDYENGFRLFQRALGYTSFGGNGYLEVFLTDDSAAEKTALSVVWPRSEQFLCQFHVAQAMWRWLWDSSHEIDKPDRPTLMKDFQRIMYAGSQTAAADAYNWAIESPTAQKYPNYKKHLLDTWNRRKLWCCSWRTGRFALRGNHTNNYCEAMVRVFKDLVLGRCKAYNAVSLVDFCCEQLETYFVDRLMKFSNSRDWRQMAMYNRLFKSCSYVTKDDILKDGHIYVVPSESSNGMLHEVDVELGLCSCEIGTFGKFCKHQMAVLIHFDEALPNQPRITDNDRYNSAVLALGNRAPPRSFFSSMRESQSTASSRATQPSIECSTASEEDVPTASDNQAQSVALDLSSVLESFETVTNLWKERCQNSTNREALVAAFEKLRKRTLKAKTESAFISLINTIGETAVPLRYRSGATIRVQPTAKSRRHAGVTHGAKRLAAGRPARHYQAKAIAKRAHSLLSNVRRNLPHAKARRGLW